LLYCEDIPPKVSINEAVDVGKKFGTEESGAFINGIMDSIRGALEREGTLKKADAQTDDLSK
jgi:N utilization substance protein B